MIAHHHFESARRVYFDIALFVSAARSSGAARMAEGSIAQYFSTLLPHYHYATPPRRRGMRHHALI